MKSSSSNRGEGTSSTTVDDTEVPWTHLPLEPTMLVMCFLSPSDLCTLGSVSTLWRSYADSNEAWKVQCRTQMVDTRFLSPSTPITPRSTTTITTSASTTSTTAPASASTTTTDSSTPSPSTINYKKRYQEWYMKFRKCKEVYVLMYDLYNRLKRWNDLNGVQLGLRPGATPELLENVAAQIRQCFAPPTPRQQQQRQQQQGDFEWPADLYCWYLFCDGQEDRFPGLFGSYSFYDYQTSMQLLPLSHIGAVVKRVHRQIPGLVPFAADSLSKMHFIVNDTSLPNLRQFKRYQLITSGGSLRYGGIYYFSLATSFYSYLKHFVKNLESGNYGVRSGCIDLFPRKNIPTAITRDIKVAASSLFIPERSSPDSEYLWAYSVTLSMDSDAPNTNNSQLLSRYWEIHTDGVDTVNTVSGPGVIGMYPKMSPGATFTYESCCPLRGLSGRMGGRFRMKSDLNESEFDIVVPTFLFQIPKMITLTEQQQQDEEQNNNNTQQQRPQ